MQYSLISTLVGSSITVILGRGVLPPSADRRKLPRWNEVIRRPGRDQGRAIQILGHALEYLIRSQRNGVENNHLAVQQAVTLLAAKTRAVFAECPEVLPLSRRLKRWLPEFLTLPGFRDLNELHYEQFSARLELRRVPERSQPQCTSDCCKARQAGDPPSKGMVALTVNVDARTYARLSRLRAKQQKTLEQLLAEALNLFLKRSDA